MKKLMLVILAVVLIVGTAVFVWAQADAGFMDSPWGQGYACFDARHGNFAGFCAGWNSPKPELPCDCSAY